MLVSRSSYRSLPLKPGVYLFLDQNNEVLYIGKAKNLKNRVSSYFTNLNLLGPKTKLLVSKIRKIKIVVVPSEIEALLLEANYIKKYKPKYNVKLTYGKTYPFIRITVKDKYPKILVTRKTDDKTSTYFGPFLNSQSPRIILRTIRRIFPFQSSLHHPNRPCLYYHLGLCPCPEIFKNEEYQKNIKRIITFLEGKTKKVIKDLRKQRDALSKKDEFEKAHRVQKKIDSIEFITNPTYQFDYKIDPNLTQDILKRQLDSLKKCLLQNRVHVKKLKRIECYDISNIRGAYATGSMVAFTNGEKDSSEYRRFKIRSVDKVPNDFAMMEEVIRRRLNHKEWQFPDLIIVDGGKGQVSSAMNALREQEVKIPVIGLAKREEVIIIPLTRHSGKRRRSASRISFDYTERRDSGVANAPQNDERRSFIEISLDKDSPVLHLLMKIRDEAHRFAVFYHRKIRSKHLILTNT